MINGPQSEPVQSRTIQRLTMGDGVARDGLGQECMGTSETRIGHVRTEYEGDQGLTSPPAGHIRKCRRGSQGWNAANQTEKHGPGPCLSPGGHAQKTGRVERTHEHHHLVVLIVHFAPEVSNGKLLLRQEMDIDDMPPPCGQHSQVRSRSPTGPLLK